MKRKAIEKKLKQFIKKEKIKFINIQDNYTNYSDFNDLNFIIDSLGLLYSLSENQSECDTWISASIWKKYSIVFNQDVQLDVSSIESLSDDLYELNEQAKKVIEEIKKGIK